jgi:hypothetical protein
VTEKLRFTVGSYIARIAHIRLEQEFFACHCGKFTSVVNEESLFRVFITDSLPRPGCGMQAAAWLQNE